MAAAPGRARVHLHLDAGMARDGAAPAGVAAAVPRRPAGRAARRGRGGRADGPPRLRRRPGRPVQRPGAHAGSRGRLEIARACGLRPAQRHLAATAATLTDPRSHHTMSRVGAGLVGIDPSRTTPPAAGADADRPAGLGTPGARRHAGRLRPRPPVAAEHLPRAWCRSGTPTGCRARRRAGPRSWYRGRRAPVVGRISMDQAVVDLGPDGGRARRDRHRVRPGRRAASRPWPTGRPGPAPSSTRSSPASAAGSRAARSPATAAAERPVTTRVAVIGGGQNCEHEVSLASAAERRRGARPRGVRGRAARPSAATAPGATAATGRWDWPGSPRSCAAARWRSRSCTGRAARTARWPRSASLAGLRYVGSGVGAGALAMDKWATKLVAEALGIATAPGAAASPPRPAHVVPWTGPVVVKPVAAGSSRGVTLVRDAEPRWLRRSTAALALGPRALVEDVVVGREIDVAVLAPGRRLAAGRRRRWRSSATGSSTTTPSTAAAPTSGSRRRSTRPTPRRSRTPRSRCTTRSGCSGVARVDFFLTERRPGAQRGEHDARA